MCHKTQLSNNVQEHWKLNKGNLSDINYISQILEPAQIFFHFEGLC